MKRSLRISTLLQRKKAPPTTILDLNEDCLREVFEVMELSDLAAVADVCSRFRSIAQAHFKALRVKHLVFTELRENDAIIEEFERASGLLRNFGAYAESIEVHGNGHSFVRNAAVYVERLQQLIIRHCGENITKIQLRHIGFEHSDRFMASIPTFKKLKTLLFAYVRDIRFADILMVCKNLKELTELHFVGSGVFVTEAEILKLVQFAPKLREFQFLAIACKSTYSTYPGTFFCMKVKTYKKLVQIVKRRRKNTPLTIYMFHEPIPANLVDDSVTILGPCQNSCLRPN